MIFIANCWNRLHFSRTENKIESHKKVCENNDLCNIVCLLKTLKYQLNQYQKSDKVPFVIYADVKCLTEKIDGYKNNPGKWTTAKVGEYIFCIAI